MKIGWYRPIQTLVKCAKNKDNSQLLKNCKFSVYQVLTGNKNASLCKSGPRKGEFYMTLSLQNEQILHPDNNNGQKFPILLWILNHV